MNTNNAYCFIQCRSGSTRFPGKCFQEIKGEPIINRVYRLCRQVVENTVVLIPDNDVLLIEHLGAFNIPCFAGSENDVLNRYIRAAYWYKADSIVRITADCPALDVGKLKVILSMCLKIGCDFGSNAFPGRTTADGEDVEFVSVRALQWVGENAKEKHHREHVTKYIYDNIEDFNKAGMSAIYFHNHIHAEHIKTSIDTPEDLERVRRMVV